MRTGASADISILMTGGTGFFGRACLRHWMEQERSGAHGYSVTVLARAPVAFLAQFPEFSNLPWLNFHTANILKTETLPANGRFTHILHAATDSTYGPGLAPLQRYDQIVQGTRNMLDFAIHCGSKRFLLTSSGAVYGPQLALTPGVEEDYLGSPDPMDSASSYGLGKRAAEHLCALYSQAYGLDTVVARCFAFVGPDLPLNVHFAIGNFIRDALWADAIRVGGDGSPIRSYMDQSDLARWLLELLIRGRSGQAYNVGSPEAITIVELAHLVRETLAPRKRVHILGRGAEKGIRNCYVPDVSKVCKELGLGVSVSLRESIARTASAHTIV